MPTGPSGAGEGDTEGLATDHVSKEASKSGDDVRRTYMHLAMHPIFMFMHVHVSNDRTGCSLHTLRSAASMVDERGGLDIDCMSIEREGDVFLGLALHHVASYRWVRGERIQIKVCEICACAPHRQKDPISDDTFGVAQIFSNGSTMLALGKGSPLPCPVSPENSHSVTPLKEEDRTRRTRKKATMEDDGLHWGVSGVVWFSWQGVALLTQDSNQTDSLRLNGPGFFVTAPPSSSVPMSHPVQDCYFQDTAEMKKREGLKRREIGFRPMALETNGYCTDVSYAVVADAMIGLGRDLKR
ncbi:hypothetical protein E4U23_001743 [Claviceps purpurea]|nr:hypothetical protein E4U23_001743 [Claviceps purpurea]